MPRFFTLLAAASLMMGIVISDNLGAEEGRSGFAEIIGHVEDWRESEPIETPWNRNRDQGGYGKKFGRSERRKNFTFNIKANRRTTIHTLEIEEKDRKPFEFEAGKTYQV
ncbi:MAG: hypothetical protein VB875_12410, partial [Pirellulales bacterium]